MGHVQFNNTSISLWSSKFADPALEKEYGSFVMRTALGKNRAVMLFGILVFLAYIAFDRLVLTSNFELILFLRLTYAALSIGLIYLTYSEFGRRNHQVLSCLMIALACAVICIIIAVEQTSVLLYYASFIQMALIFVVLLNLSFALTAALLAAIFCSYTMTILMLPPSRMLLGSVIVLLNTFAMIGCISFFLERHRRLAFLKHLAKERITLRLKAMIDEASESLQRRNTLMNIITHVFKTPLHQIIGFTELLENDLLENDQSEESLSYTKAVSSASRGLLEQVNRLLTLSRIEAGSLMARPCAFRLEELIDLAITKIDPLEENRHRFDISQVPQVSVMADPEQTGTAFGELLLNALQYATPDTPIKISVASDANKVTLSISNQGDALTDAQFETIYSPLTDKIDYRNVGGQSAGIGIGLALRLSQLNQGRVFVSNLDHKQGVLAKLTMPILHQPTLSLGTPGPDLLEQAMRKSATGR